MASTPSTATIASSSVTSETFPVLGANAVRHLLDSQSSIRTLFQSARDTYSLSRRVATLNEFPQRAILPANMFPEVDRLLAESERLNARIVSDLQRVHAMHTRIREATLLCLTAGTLTLRGGEFPPLPAAAAAAADPSPPPPPPPPMQPPPPITAEQILFEARPPRRRRTTAAATAAFAAGRTALETLANERQLRRRARPMDEPEVRRMPPPLRRQVVEISDTDAYDEDLDEAMRMSITINMQELLASVVEAAERTARQFAAPSETDECACCKEPYGECPEKKVVAANCPGSVIHWFHEECITGYVRARLAGVNNGSVDLFGITEADAACPCPICRAPLAWRDAARAAAATATAVS